MKALLRLHSEALDPGLKQIFLAFDQYCEDSGIKYSIECDEHNEQSYLVRHDHKIDGLLERMTRELVDLNIVMDVDRNRRDGVLLHFTIRPIVDHFEKADDEASMTDDRFKHKLDQRLSEEVIGLGVPEVLVTVSPTGTSSSKETVEVGTTETVQYSIQGTQADLKLVDEIMHAINDGRQVGGACFSAPVRVMRLDNAAEITDDSKTDMPTSPIDELGEKLMRVLAIGA